jgi:hypothetical protein
VKTRKGSKLRRRVSIPASWLKAAPEVGYRPGLWWIIRRRCQRRKIRVRQLAKMRVVALEVLREQRAWLKTCIGEGKRRASNA